MFEKFQKMEVSTEEIAVIEAALHTQSQILSLQANAGGDVAREKLNQVKRTLTSLRQQQPSKRSGSSRSKWGWAGILRMFGFGKSSIN